VGTTAPQPPRDISKRFRELWTKTRQALESQGTWQASDAELLSRYVRALERAHLAREDLKREDGTVVLTAIGSKDQIIQHPSVKTAREAEQDADARARMLLLSPEARAKAGDVGAKKPGGKFGLD
jgi:P27 family predicted phage terminase small subunit